MTDRRISLLKSDNAVPTERKGVVYQPPISIVGANVELVSQFISYCLISRLRSEFGILVV